MPGFDVLSEPKLEQDCGLKHPWDRRPEFGEKHPPARRGFCGDNIRTLFGSAPTGFGCR
jgi:hypothetical protein